MSIQRSLDNTQSRYLLKRYTEMMTEIRSFSPVRISRLRKHAVLESKYSKTSAQLPKLNSLKLPNPLKQDSGSSPTIQTARKHCISPHYNDWEIHEACKYPRDRRYLKPRENVFQSSRFLESYMPKGLEDYRNNKS